MSEYTAFYANFDKDDYNERPVWYEGSGWYTDGWCDVPHGPFDTQAEAENGMCADSFDNHCQ